MTRSPRPCRRHLILSFLFLPLLAVATGPVRQEAQSGLDFVPVAGGCYRMGDVFGDGEHNEQPAREVCVGDFHLSRTEVTQGAWKRVMGDNPAAFALGDDYPVESVLLTEIEAFIARLNAGGNGVFRLPSEAEWEYACRAGGAPLRHGAGDGMGPLDATRANTGGESGNASAGTQPVGSHPPNALGLYDMSGNVWEWVADVYAADAYRQLPRDNPLHLGAGPSRVVRGGSWMHPDGFARCGKRHMHCRPSVRYDAIGFRLVWDPPASP